MSDSKVFGVGFPKTGTTSLKHALRRLGYRVPRNVRVRPPHTPADLPRLARPLLDDFDGFQDLPWPLMYRELDERFPGSRFVLTIRPTHEWIQSAVRHFGGTTTPLREWLYGVGDPVGNEEIWTQRYEAHNAAVLEHFADRPGDLLVFRTGEGHGWSELCSFLGREIPAEDFPRANTAEKRAAKRGMGQRIRRSAQRQLRELSDGLNRRLTRAGSPLGRSR